MDVRCDLDPVPHVTVAGRVMGTHGTVLVVGASAELAHQGFGRLRELELAWSRFVPTSDISRLNACAGRPVEVSTDTKELVQRSVDAWTLTRGLFDATQLAAVVAAGYDASFDDLPADRPGGANRLLSALFTPADIAIDGTSITVPPCTGIDPGGIGKGLAADIVTRELIACGARGVMVNVGGDLRVEGESPHGTWTIDIDHPATQHPTVLPNPLTRVGLVSGAVASSTTLKRRWLVDGTPHHHLIDPRTGAPSTSRVEFATAIAAHGWQAEAIASAALLDGATFDSDEIESLVVADDHRIEYSPGFHRFTDPVTCSPVSFFKENNA